MYLTYLKDFQIKCLTIKPKITAQSVDIEFFMIFWFISR